MCVHSVILDQARVAERLGVEIQDELLTVEGETEDPAIEWVQRQELWQEVDARLRNESERRVVYGTFVLGMKPREIYAQFQETFRDVNEVYRNKENVLARLRRDGELKELLSGDA